MENGILDESLGNELFSPSDDGSLHRLGKTLAQLRIVETGTSETFGSGHAGVRYLTLVHSGTTEPLHSQQYTFQPGRFM
jgi:hypothetical protein